MIHSLQAAAGILLLQIGQGASNDLFEKVLWIVVAACIGQLVVLGIGLLGFKAVVSRAIDKEIPAQLSSVNDNIKNIHEDLDNIGKTLFEMQRRVDKHDYKIENLEEWRKSQAQSGNLDDTRGGPRNPSGQPPRRR